MVCSGMISNSAWIDGTFSVSSTWEFGPATAFAEHCLAKADTGDGGNASALLLQFTFLDKHGHTHTVDLTPNYSDVSTYHVTASHDQMTSATFEFFGTYQFAVSLAHVFLFT